MQLHYHTMQNRDYAAEYFPLIRDDSRIADSLGSRRPTTELLHRCDSQSHSLAHIKRIYVCLCVAFNDAPIPHALTGT